MADDGGYCLNLGAIDQGQLESTAGDYYWILPSKILLAEDGW